MTTTRRFHTVLAVVAALGVAAPGAASAKPKVKGVKALQVGAMATDGGAGSQADCDHYADLINQETAIINTNKDINVVIKAIDDRNTLLAYAQSAGCAIYGGPDAQTSPA